MKEKISITVDKQTLKNVDSFVDRLFIRSRSQAIEVLLKNYLDKRKTAVIILTASDKRLKIDENQEVPFVKIKGMTLIERTIKKLRKNSFRDIYIIARKRTLEGIFALMKGGEQYGIKINYIEEKDSSYKSASLKSHEKHLPETFLTGSATALKLAKKELSRPFLVIFGDVFFDHIDLNDLWDFHIKNDAISTLCLITYKDPSKKGEVHLKGRKIIEFKQKPKKGESILVCSPLLSYEPEIPTQPENSLK